ncbi:ArsR family transcriptional regulator [Pseudonocardia sp. GCM10023141]|uniref:ArsR family transcriptional regulator n=1 Tax=Pseudonocardia sp. GCM10023141 TaxID=3252653 RepID=UPI00360F1C32
MLRIHFTARDVLRVRVLPSMGPMAETLHSLSVLRLGRADVTFREWRRQVHATIGARPPELGALVSEDSFLDLASLSGLRQDMDESIEAVLAADPAAVQSELDFHTRALGRLPDELRGLADDRRVRAALMGRLAQYHRAAVAPVWKGIRAHLFADRVTRSRALLDEGMEGLLATLHPEMRWESMTLHLPRSADHEIRLDGRGVTLAPSFFLRRPAAMVDTITGDCTVTYPARLEIDGPGTLWTAADANRDLAKLLGRTRAVLLGAIAGGLSGTGELAARAGTSAAAVSQHTKVLREAGLIISMRHGPAVRHTLTPRGSLLLDRPRTSRTTEHAGLLERIAE